MIEDICRQLASALEKNSDLRSADSYEAYSASITVAIQFQSLGTTQIDEVAVIGDFDPDRPSCSVEMNIPSVYLTEARERSHLYAPGLERSETTVPSRRRFYAPRARSTNE